MCIEKKSVKTVHDGVTYDSRLEAKYAIIFDALGIEYEYHVETYEFEDGTKYEPDFYLPQLRMWFEAKGVMLGYDEHKIKMLEKESTERVIVGTNNFAFENVNGEIMYFDGETFTYEPCHCEELQEAIRKAKNFRFGDVIEDRVVDGDFFTRLMDLKATYLNNFYKIEFLNGEYVIINRGVDTRTTPWVETGYVVLVSRSDREDFKVSLWRDKQIVSISVKEKHVAEVCKKFFRIGYELYDAGVDEVEGAEYITHGMNKVCEYLQEG